MSQYRAKGRVYRRNVKAVIAAANGLCALCGHYGARQGDHIIPVSLGGHPTDPHNLQPAHGGARGAADNPCPECGLRCNQIKGNRVNKVLTKVVVSRNW